MYALKTRDIENQTDIAVFHVGMSLLHKPYELMHKTLKYMRK